MSSRLLLSLEDYEEQTGFKWEDTPWYKERENSPIRCAYCGAWKRDGVFMHKDHVIPKSRGGSNDNSNLVYACDSCNVKKRARTPEEAGMPIIYIEGSRVR